MKLRQSIFLIPTLTIIALLAACSSNNSSPSGNTTPPAITVSVSAAAASVATGGTDAITATLTNDTTNAGVTWSVSCGSSGACGSFNPTTTTTGVATTYTAPSAVPTGNTVTITATSVAQTSVSGMATVTITAPTSAVVITPTSGSSQITAVGTPFGAPLAATVTTNGTPTAGASVTFTAPSSGASGMFATSPAAATDTETTNASGVATSQAFTANDIIGANTVTATVSGASTPASFSLTNASPTLTNGNYVFSLAGTNANDGTFYFVEGQFTLLNGAVTGGEQDYVDNSTPLYATDPITGGALTVNADGNMTIVLNTSDTNVGNAGIETLDAAAFSSTRARIIEFDTLLTSSGRIDAQSSTAAPTEGYAFYLGGVDNSSVPTVIGGVLDFSGTAGSGSEFDVNDGGSVSSAQTFSSVSVASGPDASGRMVVSLVPTSGPTINVAAYAVDTAHMRFVETSGDTFVGALGGVALGQGANTGTFTTASVSGATFVFGALGADATGTDTAAGMLTTNTDGTTVGGAINYNDLTAAQSGPSTITMGTYVVDPSGTGRVTLSNVTDGVATFNVELYLTGNGSEAEITAVTLDSTDALAGLGFTQTGGGSFTAGSFLGSYAASETGVDPTGAELDAVGPLTADGVGSLSGTADVNWLGAAPPALTPIGDASVSGAFTAAANGAFTGTITGLDVTNCQVFNSNGTGCTNDAFSIYLVDTTKAFAIETDTNQLTLGFFTLDQ